jgi:hypothetical protein
MMASTSVSKWRVCGANLHGPCLLMNGRKTGSRLAKWRSAARKDS